MARTRSFSENVKARRAHAHSNSCRDPVGPMARGEMQRAQTCQAGLTQTMSTAFVGAFLGSETVQKLLFVVACSVSLTSAAWQNGVTYTSATDLFVYCTVYCFWLVVCLPWLLINVNGKNLGLIAGVVCRLFAAEIGTLTWAACKGQGHLLLRGLRLKPMFEPSLTWLAEAGYNVRYGVIVACLVSCFLKFGVKTYVRLASSVPGNKPTCQSHRTNVWKSEEDSNNLGEVAAYQKKPPRTTGKVVSNRADGKTAEAQATSHSRQHPSRSRERCVDVEVEGPTDDLLRSPALSGSGQPSSDDEQQQTPKRAEAGHAPMTMTSKADSSTGKSGPGNRKGFGGDSNNPRLRPDGGGVRAGGRLSPMGRSSGGRCFRRTKRGGSPKGEKQTDGGGWGETGAGYESESVPKSGYEVTRSRKCLVESQRPPSKRPIRGRFGSRRAPPSYRRGLLINDNSCLKSNSFADEGNPLKGEGSECVLDADEQNAETESKAKEIEGGMEKPRRMSVAEQRKARLKAFNTFHGSSHGNESKLVKKKNSWT